MSLKHVTIHTDGAARGNPGPGGYGVVQEFDGRRKQLAQGFARTTNNRMELMAAIAGLEALKERCRVTLHSDSRYLIDALTKGWLKGWKARHWIKADRQPVKNIDLWQRLEEAARRHQVEWKWLRGHAGHAENEACDRLAVKAASAPGLPPDEGFEQGGGGS